MATERVNLTMDQTALVAARHAAETDGTSLSEWLSRAAWDRAIEQAARISAQQDRHLSAEFDDWDTTTADQIFGGANAA